MGSEMCIRDRMKAYPIKEATVRTAVRVFTWLTRIAVPATINASAKRLALKVVISPCGSGRLEVRAIFASIFPVSYTHLTLPTKA